MAEDARRYRFGPLERRGLVGSLRPVQVLVLAVSLTAGVVLMRLLPRGGGVLSALGPVPAAIAFCCWPVGGRSAEAWLPCAGRFAARRLRGRLRRLSDAPQAGTRIDTSGRPVPVVSLPAAAEGLEVLAAPFRGEEVGVVKDRRTRSF